MSDVGGHLLRPLGGRERLAQIQKSESLVYSHDPSCVYSAVGYRASNIMTLGIWLHRYLWI